MNNTTTNITTLEYHRILDICTMPNSPFYYVDQQKGDGYFRIFGYRMASYQDWMVDPLTFEMRELMVAITDTGEFIRVASRPPRKFFNLGESPLTQNLDLSGPATVADKADGSLISTFCYWDTTKGRICLGLKSKMSLVSVQVEEAYKIVEDTPGMYDMLLGMALVGGLTVYMELCSPNNRIVLGYPTPHLVILGVRDTISGYECTRSDIEDARAKRYWVDTKVVQDLPSFIDTVGGMVGIEGYVVLTNNGVRFKVKTEWYRKLHQCKDSINNPRGLFEAIINEGADELLSIFAEDVVLVSRINDETVRVRQLWNDMTSRVETFYEENKSLSRKDYAIKGQSEIPKFFSLAMNLYLGKAIDYTEFAIKNYQLFSA
jgi:T4 RnlA family RNA ligase